MTKTSLKDRVIQNRPDVAGNVSKQALKASVAHMLRELRKSSGFTQVQVAEASGIDQSVISKMESPLGPLPALLTFQRYVTACNGHMVMGVSPAQITAPMTEEALGAKVNQPVFAMGI